MAGITRRLTGADGRPLPSTITPTAEVNSITVLDRFPNTLAIAAPLPTPKQVSASNVQTALAVAKLVTKPVLVRLGTARGPRFQLEVSFSEDKGQSFGAELHALPSVTYMVQMTFTQHQAEPLLEGADFLWQIPTGWTYVDGQGALQHEQCVCNPLQITRKIRSPGAIAQAFVKVLCQKVYG